MILVDTSVWIDHLRRANAALALALSEGQVVQHPFVTAELALGSLSEREKFVTMLGYLPAAPVADQAALLCFVADHQLFGTGLGMVDAHLLASAADQPDLCLWTLDKRLSIHAERLGLSHDGR
jgi:predicted nucleic acid-binding protein